MSVLIRLMLLYSQLAQMKSDFERQMTTLDMLIELVISDGMVDEGELAFIRFIVTAGRWDVTMLRKAKPEWSQYIQEGFETATELRSSVMTKMIKGAKTSVND